MTLLDMAIPVLVEDPETEPVDEIEYDPNVEAKPAYQPETAQEVN